jgi:hypothetical protein
MQGCLSDGVGASDLKTTNVVILLLADFRADYGTMFRGCYPEELGRLKPPKSLEPSQPSQTNELGLYLRKVALVLTAHWLLRRSKAKPKTGG